MHLIIQMKQLVVLTLLLAILHAQQVGPVVYYVSGSPDSISNPVYSSVRGGRLIYIKVTGHSLMASENLVYVGAAPCVIPSDGVTDTFISCETTDIGSDVSVNSQQVTVISKSVAFTTSWPNVVHFQPQASPLLNQIFPTTGYANKQVFFNGIHRITDLGRDRQLGGIKQLRIGGDLCSRFDISQEPIYAHINQYIKCISSPLQIAGKYNVTEKVTPGIARKGQNLRRASLQEDQFYQFAVLPTVTQITPNSGNLGGQNITIRGTGFSNAMDNNTVSINGNNCKVTAASDNTISCTVAPYNAARTALLSTTASTQKNGYFSGAGLKYARYGVSSSTSMDQFVAAVRGEDTTILGTPREVGVRGQLKEGNAYGSNYGQVFKGYFTAPVDGTYVFRGVADQIFSFYMSTDTGSTQTPATPLIFSNVYQPYWSNFYIDDVPDAEGQVVLVGGKSYYIEAYHINRGGDGNFKIEVDVPNANANLPFQVHEVHKLVTETNVQPEVVRYTMTGATFGKINLKLVRRDKTGEITYNVNKTVNYGCSDADFESALNSFNSFKPFFISVTRTIMDAGNNVITAFSSITDIIHYDVSIYKKRSLQFENEDFIYTYSNCTGTITKQFVTEHSPLLTGSFSFEIGGQTFDSIPYNASAGVIQNHLRSIVGYEQVAVDQYSKYGKEYSNTWIIRYIGVNSAIPTLTPNAAGLTGGVGSPTVTNTVRRTYSSKVTISPVDYRFLNTASNKINVLVNTNGMPSICTGNCEYTFFDKFRASSLTRTGTTLSLSISNPTSVAVTQSAVSILVQGLPCTLTGTFDISSITCTLTKNTDNTALLIAGNVAPLIFISPHGIVGLDDGSVFAGRRLLSAVSPFFVPLVTSSLARTNGGDNGGYLNTVSGSGFPLEVSKIKVTICGSDAIIKDVSNIQVIFFVPKCGSTGAQTVTVTVGLQTTNNLSFTYASGASSAPMIQSITPSTLNPALKSVMTITGTGFGTDINSVMVHLSNSTGKIYQLKVLSLNNTQMKVGLSGGLPGVYNVKISLPNGNGDSLPQTVNADVFKYQLIINSVSPATGSYFGGTLLTITGSNFSPAYSDTLAFIGDALNQFCNIETISTTQITCRTPTISRFYTPATPLKLVLATKLIAKSTCPSDNCLFSYMDQVDSPQITSISKTTVNAEAISVIGVNFVETTGCSISLTSESNSSHIIEVATTSCTDAQANFTIPKQVITGKYFLRVRNQIGESNGELITVNWAVGTSAHPSGGSIVGNRITYAGGSGYPQKLGNGFNVFVLSTNGNVYPVEVISCCVNNQLIFEVPAIPDNNSITIVFQSPFNRAQRAYKPQLAITPNITIASGAALAPGVSTITFTRTDTLASTPITAIKLVSTVNKANQYIIPTWNGPAPTFTFNVDLKSGSYHIRALTKNGYCMADRTINVSLITGSTVTTKAIAYSGGEIKIIGSNLSPSSFITVNSLRGNIKEYSASQVTYHVPALVTPLTQSTYGLKKVEQLDMKSFAFSSDQNATVSNVSAAFDGQITTIYGSPNAACWIRVDVGSGLQAVVDRVRFFPFLNWVNTANYTLDGTFQASNDQTTWTKIGTIDQTVHSGWNVIRSQSKNPFRYFQFKHTSQSQCNLAQFQLYGYVVSQATVSATTQVSDLIYNDGFNTQTFAGKIEYKQINTPTVNSVVPPYGDIFGTYTITIFGTNLNDATAVILIDDIPCVYVSSDSSQLVCTVGARPNIPAKNSFSVSINGNKAIINNGFLYVLKWSDARTWGVDAPPIEGDLVYVPPGMTLLIDQDTPILLGIAVQKGNLIFPNDTSKSVTVRTGFITLNGGQFIAGTESAPLYSNLTFIMYGGYYGKQQPMFGNKGIGCMDCKFSMYGRPRKPTWTTISATININDTTLTVTDDVDWKVGETIVVAATSFYHFEAEQRVITGITGKTITVNEKFKHKHVSVVQSLGSKDKITMRAEVGLLSRNIKMMGDPTSVVGKYGSHLMLSGMTPDGLEGQVAYSQFTHCGQPQILGRYCIHFHMAKEVPTSFVRGNAVHQSFARVVTIHGVYQLTVEENVGYRVRGHNFFIEDGIETHNTIRNNLAISSLQVTNMLQTDTSVASFWVTNPTNDFYGNHAAGGDFYGFWYEIKPNPDGPSATNDVCPTGNPLGYVANNVAHSYTRFGLRVFQLFSRKYPCRAVRNDSNANNPWQFNPSIPSVFYNFTIYKNLEAGVLSQQSGNIQFKNFTIAQNYRAGVQFYKANFTNQMVSVDNCVIVGKTVTNAQTDTSNYTKGMAAVITPRTGQSNITNTRFYHYPTGSIAFVTCSFCDDLLLYTNKGSDVFLKNLTFFGVNGSYLFMVGMKRDVIYDLDGSLSASFDGNTTRKSATIVSNFAHISTQNGNDCPPASVPSLWDNAIMCNHTVTVRRVFFTNLLDKYVFNTQFMKAVELSSIDQIVPEDLDEASYTAVQSLQGNMQPKKEKPFTYSLPFITGKMYQIWWGSGMDFDHLSIEPSKMLSADDLGIIFKFNYTQNRQLFKIGPMRGGKLLTSIDYIGSSSASKDITPSKCTNGQYYHNNDASNMRMLEICISGRNRSLYEYMQINAVVCEFLCPAPPGTFQKEDFIRKWSNATQWPNGQIPKAGQNVTVNGSWTVLLDIDPNPADYMIIDGTIIADDTRDVLLTARSIFIRSGNITVGTPTKPFLHNFTIQINNTKSDKGWFIDEVVAGNKYLVVSGSLNLYGNAPDTVQTFLTKSASKNDKKIFVKSRTDWAIGDTLGISPSYGTYSEYETVTITGFDDDGSVSITPLLYNHYGSSGPLKTTHGSIDVNSYVAHLNRNIKVVPGPDVGWGVNILVYGYTDGDKVRRDGYVDLSGVQIQDGGQYDTTASALQFLNVMSDKYTSVVQKTSFINCKAWCINVENVRNVTIKNNVFYNAWVFGARVKGLQNFDFTNNLFIGVTARPSVPFGGELVACFATFDYISPSANVNVNNNLCLGSQGHGFAVPHIKCDQLETNPFRDNTAGSCQIGFIFNNIAAADGCKGFSYARAYGCQIGQICGPGGSKAIWFDNFIMVDNQRGITLKMGGSEGTTNHTALLTNSYVSTLSRPDCDQCYGTGALKCSNNVGVRAFSASANGELMPKKFGGGYDVICKQQLYEAKAYVTNVTFDAFRQTYTNPSVASKCSKNFAFRPHGGTFSASGDHNLFDVHCTNCDTSSYLYAEPNHKSELGWFGGCGDIICTGKSNYVIIDWDGTFLGFKGTIIPNNTVIAQNEPNCVEVPSMNSHICTRTDFAVLAYQSIAPDFNTRIMWPVALTYDGGNYTTITNGWREWQWMGKEPLNKRFGRFLSIIKLNSTYNLTYTAMPPVKMQFQIQKRTPEGDNNNFIVAKQHYPLPNMIQIKVNGVVKDPILVTDSGLSRTLNTKVCGDNAYFFTNYTIHFVVTEDRDCLVEVSLTETIQLTTRFAIDVADFFANNKMSSFISNLCALLGITDTSRVKVVGVISGSTEVQTLIGGSSAPNEPTTSAVQSTLTNNQQSVMVGLSNNVAPVLSIDSSYHADPSVIVPSEQESMMQSNIGLIVGISVGAVVVGITIAVIFCYFLRKRAKIVEEIHQSEEEAPEKEGGKVNYHHQSHFDVKQGSQNSEFKFIPGNSTKVNVRNVEGFDD